MIFKYLHPHYVNELCIRLSYIYWNTINKLNITWWNIHIGKGCKFRGNTIFRKLPNSSITIGNRCSFNSSHKSNLIGVYSPCMISTIQQCAQIEIGNNCGFSGTVIAAATHIRLGNNVRCGANTLITDSDWHIDDYRSGKNQPVIIEDNVWLGYDVKILKGVHIGENSFIGAGSIVTKDIPANVVAAGNPCKIIKEIK